MPKKTLIREATIVSMDPTIGDLAKGDILIVDDRIAQIASTISADDAEIVDAEGMIASPGFVDTHRHVWQTQLKGAAINWSLFDYACLMRSMYSVCYSPDDAYLGNYVGALDAINAGITSMVDHGHLQISPDHSDQLVQGLKDSGIRGIMCYGIYRNPKYQPGDALTSEKIVADIAGPLDDFHRQNAARVREKHFPSNDGLMQFGIATSEWVNFTDMAPILMEMQWARTLEPSRISIHISYGVNEGFRIIPQLLEHGELGDDLLFVHGNNLTLGELSMLRQNGGWLSITPESELQMGMGYPVLERVVESGSVPSLGIDIASNYAGDMFAQMRLMLQTMRFRDFEVANAGLPTTERYAARKMLEFATIGGAICMGMEDITGSLTPGKKADIILTRMDSVNMSPVRDPIAALVFYADAADIDSVWVDGVARKRGGLLTGLDWDAVRGRLIRSRDHIYEEFAKIDEVAVRNAWAPLWGISKSAAEPAVKVEIHS
ncbi:amidohydrolase family protein [Novosphingobium sp. PP1Y]|uniref:amidohydrolase family protein n=1 Tax=Novosphingobium sp. PP1Y TaxID=702113 RepID=UPI00020EEB3C|nr:amidohydrolase family protein [Novosphingobium sp. PP1Y]CCA92165.1 cytosine deaminase and related metal-dependent hydrolases [Novosphingobium sp. PP1Y]